MIHPPEASAVDVQRLTSPQQIRRSDPADRDRFRLAPSSFFNLSQQYGVTIQTKFPSGLSHQRADTSSRYDEQKGIRFSSYASCGLTTSDRPRPGTPGTYHRRNQD